jgi:CheY-like chemotaxis protein
MTRISDPGSPAPGRFLGVLRSWLRTWSGATRESPEDLPGKTAVPIVQSHGSVRVLVADDNPVTLLVTSVLLESRGIVPMLAADGAEAVALACATQFDLVLMDLQMPTLDGLGAATAIRRFETGCSRPAVPVVAYSSSLPSPGVLAAHGMSGSLAKPCDNRDLEACLVRWCPTYRPEPSVRDVPLGDAFLPAASLNHGSTRASLR